jgi:hypothetical protein
MQAYNSFIGNKTIARAKQFSPRKPKKNNDDGELEEIICILFLSRANDEKVSIYTRNIIDSFSRQIFPGEQLEKIRNFVYSSFATC